MLSRVKNLVILLSKIPIFFRIGYFIDVLHLLAKQGIYSPIYRLSSRRNFRKLDIMKGGKNGSSN